MDGLSYVYDPDIRRYYFGTVASNLPNLSSYLFFRKDILSNSLIDRGNSYDFNYLKNFVEDKFVSSGVAKFKGFFVSDEERDHVDDINYSKIQNDPVNVVDSTLDEDVYVTIEHQIKELQQRVGNLRTSHKRKVEHVGYGTLSLEDLYDVSNLVGQTIQFLPPLPTDPDNPERINMRTTDRGFLDYIKDNLQTIQSAGQKTIIWDETDIPTGVLVTKDNIEVKSVHLPDLETSLDDDIDQAIPLNDNFSEFKKFLTEKSTWSIFNIPGRSVIRSNEDGIFMGVFGDAFVSIVSSVFLKPSGVIDVQATTVNINADEVNVI